VEGSSEQVNEPVGSISCWEILELKSDSEGLSSMELVPYQKQYFAANASHKHKQ
jgi:hypothetical protein